MQSDPAIAKAGLAEKAAAYQLNMGWGLLMISTNENSKESPDARREADVRQQGAALLQSYFRVPADQLQFSTKGVSKR